MGKMHVVADTEINKFLRAFDTRDEAVAHVGRLLETNGDAYGRDLAIGRQTDDGDFVDVLAGDELLAHVRGERVARDFVAVAGGASDSDGSPPARSSG